MRNLPDNWALWHSNQFLCYFVPKYNVRKVADKLAGQKLHYTMDFYNFLRHKALTELKRRGVLIDGS